VDSVGVRDATSFTNWRTETAPSADGSWLTGTIRERHARFAFVPPGVAPFGRDENLRFGWRLALWDAGVDDDIRGFPPEAVHGVELGDVLPLVSVGLRPWARAEHRRAIRQCRAAANRALLTGETDAARKADQVLAELEREDAQAKLSATHTTGADLKGSNDVPNAG
jgi:hypothetical protein